MSATLSIGDYCYPSWYFPGLYGPYPPCWGAPVLPSSPVPPAPLIVPVPDPCERERCAEIVRTALGELTAGTPEEIFAQNVLQEILDRIELR